MLNGEDEAASASCGINYN